MVRRAALCLAGGGMGYYNFLKHFDHFYESKLPEKGTVLGPVIPLLGFCPVTRNSSDSSGHMWSRVSASQHQWHVGPDRSLWETVLRIVGCLASSHPLDANTPSLKSVPRHWHMTGMFIAVFVLAKGLEATWIDISKVILEGIVVLPWSQCRGAFSKDWVRPTAIDPGACALESPNKVSRVQSDLIARCRLWRSSRVDPPPRRRACVTDQVAPEREV